MNLKTTGKSAVEEVSYGMWVWECADGEVAGDSEGNIMNVFCMSKNTPGAVKAITDAATYYGFGDGKPVWWSGKRPIDDEELEHQEARMKAGLVPDPLDIAAIKDHERALRNGQS